MSSTPSRARSPRLAGALLIVVSVGAGVAAGWLIARVPWSIPAAGLLTLATIGMAVGVLWTLRRSWTDKTWPPAGKDLPRDVRWRRSIRILGIVLLAPSPIVVALLVWVIAEGALAWNDVLLMAIPAALYGVTGVWLLRRSRLDAPAADDDDDEYPTRRAAPRRDDEWWVLGGRVQGMFMTTATVPVVVVGMISTLQLLRIVDDLPWGGVIWIVVVAAVGTATLVIVRRRQSPLEANPEEELVRFRGSILRWADLTRAELSVDPLWKGAARTVILSVGDASTRRGRIVLRRKGALELDEAETALAMRIIDASAIELPHDKDDPRGRFSRQLYPNSLTKADAAAVVAHPPGANDDLPITLPA